MPFKVLIPQDIPDAGKEYLREKGYQVIVGSDHDVDTIRREAADADAILARTAKYTQDIFQAATRLKVIARFGAGVDNIDLEAATNLGIQATNAPQANSNSVAEHAIGLLLALAKNTVRMNARARDGRWDERNNLVSREVAGKTLGLIGFGNIGRLVAKKAVYGLDMNVVAYDPFLPRERFPENIVREEDLATVFSQSDFISLHLPSMPATKGLVDRRLLRLMRPEAYLINCARGEVVNEADLFVALSENWIAGAAVDVLRQEPPAPDNPLFGLDNLVITPHHAALTAEAMDLAGIHAAMGIDEVLSGREPTWPVNQLA